MRLRLAWKRASPEETTGRLTAFLTALRVHFVPPSFLPAILCGIIAWSREDVFQPLFFLLTVMGVTVNHFGLNMVDDVFDFRQSVDRARAGEKNPYSGGSGVITANLLTDKQLLNASFACFAVTTITGLYLASQTGWPVLALGLFGLFCSIYYTAPPIRFGYRGLGELALLVNFGPVIGMGSYYVQAGKFGLEPLLVSLILGLMMWSMIIINEVPDYDDDRVAGKLNLVARFGRRAGMWLFFAGLAASYCVLLGAVAFGICPPHILLGLMSLPWAVKSFAVLRRNLQGGIGLVPANIAMIKTHFITGACLILGYVLNYFSR